MVRRESAAIRVVIADDEPVARAGLREMLADIEWLDVVGEASSGPAAVETLVRLLASRNELDGRRPSRRTADRD